MRAHANTHNMSHGDGEVHDGDGAVHDDDGDDDGDDAEVVVQDEDKDDDVEYVRMWRRKTDPNSGSYVSREPAQSKRTSIFHKSQQYV